MSNRRHLLCLLAISSLLVQGCSSGPPTAERYDKALQAVESSIRPTTSDWANTVATEADRHLRDSGAVDRERLGAGPGTQEKARLVGKNACDAIKKNRKALEAAKPSQDSGKRLDTFVTRETIVALGKFPLVLYSLRVTWPPPWLADPAHQPDFAAPSESADPAYLQTVLMPRFVGADGSFVVPERGSPDFPTFSGWINQTDSPFSGRIALVIDPISSAIRECISVEARQK